MWTLTYTPFRSGPSCRNLVIDGAVSRQAIAELSYESARWPRLANIGGLLMDHGSVF